MPLNDLSLAQLSELAQVLTQIEVAGEILAGRNLDPRFDLTPGRAVTISLSFVMPGAEQPELPAFLQAEGVMNDGESAVESFEALEAKVAELTTKADEALARADARLASMRPIPYTPSTEPPLDIVSDVVPVDPPPAVIAAGGAPQSEPSQVPGGTHENKITGPNWTEEEDARLITLVCMGVHRLSLSKTAAIRRAAKELGRPEHGTAFRCHHKLKARIDAALAEGKATAPAEVAPAATAPTDMAGHLAGLIGKNGWTVSKDIDLLQFAILGWPAGDIALELRMQTSTVKPRLDALTGLYTDEATGKQLRRFKREDVLAMLRAWVADQTAGAA